MEPDIDAMLAGGRTPEAIRIVTAAADSGDVNALMRLATWRLIGAPLPRDLPLGRTLLRRAVTIGHVDAALMEVALIANGSGGPADWPAARALLDTAAAHDEIAAQQRALLSAMALNPDGTPVAVPMPQRLSTSPNVWRVVQLLTRDECAHLAGIAAPLLERANVIHPETGRTIPHPIRTSHDAAIGPAQENPVVRAINQRIAAVSGTQVDQGEPLTILHYGVGEEYRPHIDALPSTANQRIRTVLVYLNQGFSGGETRFLANGLTVPARAGDAIIFNNVLPDGRPDQRSQHAGLPIKAGTKWLATRWIRAARYDAWNPC